jgi:hypothetical protein
LGFSLNCSMLVFVAIDALKSKVDGPTQAPGRPSILPETRIGSLFGLICNIIY